MDATIAAAGVPVVTCQSRATRYRIQETCGSALWLVEHPPERATAAKLGPGEVWVQVAIGATRSNGLGPYVRHFQLTLPYKAFTRAHEWIEMMIAARKTLGAKLGLV